VLAITVSKFELRCGRGVSNWQSNAMPDPKRELFNQPTTEKLLRQIEEGLTHSRGVIGQIDMIRQLRFKTGGPNNTLQPHVSLPALSGF
jgi:hypothetical protein